MTLFTKLFKDKPIILAPMFEVSNLPFRLFCKEQGAAASISEFISVNQLVYVLRNNLDFPKNLKYQIQTDPREQPVGLQLFGFDSSHFKELGQLFDVQKYGFNFLDLNIGCPVPKICNIGAGSKLLAEENFSKLEDILKTIKKAFPDTPFSIKIRAGYKKYLDIEKFAEIINSIDLLHVTIHPKLATVSKDKSNSVNYEISKQFVKAIDHPVIINGKITSLSMAEDLMNITGSAGAMIGRQAQKYPWVFNEKYQQEIASTLFIDGLNYLLDLNKEFGFGKLHMIRDQTLGMIRGFSGSKQNRQELQHNITSLNDLYLFIEKIDKFFQENGIEKIKNIMEKSNLPIINPIS